MGFSLFFLSNISKYGTSTEYSGFSASLGNSEIRPRVPRAAIFQALGRPWARGFAAVPTWLAPPTAFTSLASASIRSAAPVDAQGSRRAESVPCPAPRTFPHRSLSLGGPSSHSLSLTVVSHTPRGCSFFSKRSLTCGVFREPGSATVTKPRGNGKLQICGDAGSHTGPCCPARGG